MIATQRQIAIEPMKYQPSVMDRFDKLVLKAAKKKKKDIIKRYGEEGFDKLVLKGKPEEKDQGPEELRKKYEETIKDLCESFGNSPIPTLKQSPVPNVEQLPPPPPPPLKSPRSTPKTTRDSFDTKAIEKSWTWNLTKSPDIQAKRKRTARSKRESAARRQSVDLSLHSIASSVDVSLHSTSSSDDGSGRGECRRSMNKDSGEPMARETSKERKARRAQRKEAVAHAKRLEELEQKVLGNKYDKSQRRGSLGSNIDPSRKIAVRKAVRYWESDDAQAQRRMSH